VDVPGPVIVRVLHRSGLTIRYRPLMGRTPQIRRAATRNCVVVSLGRFALKHQEPRLVGRWGPFAWWIPPFGEKRALSTRASALKPNRVSTRSCPITSVMTVAIRTPRCSRILATARFRRRWPARSAISPCRDRGGTFAPMLVTNGARRLVGLDAIIVSLHADGMTVRDIGQTTPPDNLVRFIRQPILTNAQIRRTEAIPLVACPARRVLPGSGNRPVCLLIRRAGGGRDHAPIPTQPVCRSEVRA
jgi:hypothetical protein